MKEIAKYEQSSHVEALRRALRKVQHLGAEDAPRLREAFDLAAILDELILGKDPETGRLEILRVSRRYDDILADLRIGYQKPMGRPRADEKRADATPEAPAFEVVNPLQEMRAQAGLS